MDKIKLFSFIIAAEIFTLIILLILLFVNSDEHYVQQNAISFPITDIIYSKDNSVPFTGSMQDTLNDKLIVKYNVVNGFKHGEFSLLTMDGNLAVQGYMNKNKNDGNWKYYYEGGQLECTGNFSNDNPTGKWKWFYQNGAKKCEGIYINGKPEGIWRKYNADGTTI
jgi:antitoxin component YwqK of YwqJK toxin-antitoxin module